MADEENKQSEQQAPLSHVQKQKARSNFWKKAIVVFIGIVMIASTAGFMLNSNSSNSNNEKLPENAFIVGNYTFYNASDGSFGTYFQFGGNKTAIRFRLDPREAGNISLDDIALRDIVSAKKLYITTDPQGTDLGNIAVAAYEISRIIGLSSIPTVGAYTRDSDPPNPDVPIRTCTDASNTTTIILLETGNFTGISDQNYCVHISGTNSTELIKAADKLGMNLLGIRL
jgi:hypothetical protein